MFRCLLFCGLFCLVWSHMKLQNYPPSKGKVWPKPRNVWRKATFFTFTPNQFQFSIINQKCSILDNVVVRYKAILDNLYQIAQRELMNRESWSKEKDIKFMFRRYRVEKAARSENRKHYRGNIRGLNLNLTRPCDEYPHLGMNENYTLSVSETATLNSDSIWGIIRGMETFSQLFYLSANFEEVRINSSEIKDYPRYAHRGLMLDTARHFISVDNILKTLDAMAMNKMNVFHWHIVDDESFPFESERLPELSELGAFHNSMVYTKSDVINIIEYARLRGIRVLPEFDVPGHTASWEVAYPHALTKCYGISLRPMNPIKNNTYKLISNLFQEVQERFPDKYFHIGGNEVNLKCWLNNPEIRLYMRKNNITSSKNLLNQFILKVIGELNKDTSPILWQDVVDNGIILPKDSIIQIQRLSWINDTINLLKHGHRVIFSSSWALDNQYLNFEDIYLVDPRETVRQDLKNDSLLQNLVGGEASMFTAFVNNHNVHSRLWPKTSAVAEVLWSSTQLRDELEGNVLLKTLRPYHERIEEHSCRMIRRGIDVEPPNGPGFCLF